MARRSTRRSGKTKQEKRSKAKVKAKLARSADRHMLYEEAVQAPEDDVKFIKRAFKKHFGRLPRLLREDFCGTALLACRWVEQHKENRAFGVDLDPEPLAWGREHHVSKLTPDQSQRLELIESDALDAKVEAVDVTVAFNFSYFIFKQRAELLNYFKIARAGLRDEGIFIIDLYGGADAHTCMEERRDHDTFEYVWDQDLFDPITHHVINYIHFEFPDGSKLRKAFSYDWRLWTIPELRDLLDDAGFSSVTAYWEGTDAETDEGSGEYYEATSADDDPAFVTYLVARR